MKRIPIIIMALLSVVVMSSFVLMNKDNEKRSLETLWRQYEAARKEDRVRDMAGILEQIRDKAFEDRASWDYFLAWEEYVNARSCRNWKLRDSLRMQASAALEAYGVPAMHMLFELRQGTGHTNMRNLVEKYEQDLIRSSNSDIYGKAQIFDGGEFNGFMSGRIENDYEFVLWAIRKYQGFGNDWIYARLGDYLGDRYPEAPYARYINIAGGVDMEDEMSGLQELADEYKGRGIGMLAEDNLLRLRLEKMDRDGASGADYRRLEKEIVEFIADGRKLAGDEAVIFSLASKSEYTLEQLRRKEAWADVKSGEVNVVFRNLAKVEFRMLKDKRTVYRTEVANPAGSFYKPDTVKVDVPLLDDGVYVTEIHVGKECLDEGEYSRHTVSLATRYASDGMGVYAADYMTGEPLDKADILLYDSDGDMVAEAEDFEFDGFTVLPKEIYPLKDDKAYYIVCRYEDGGVVRLSKKMRVRNEYASAHDSSKHLSAVIMKDRGAYVPGDTVKFKAVFYYAFPDGSMKVSGKGREILARLMDPRGKTVAETMLTTNEFGSVSGTFAVDVEGMNGTYHLVVYDDSEGRTVAGSSNVKVDEFLLPSYDLSFDKPDRVYFPGDTVRVSGRAVNYSGHGFSELEAEADIVIDYNVVETREVEIRPDGSFEIIFKAGEDSDESVRYGVDIVITDRTGETLEFEHGGFLRSAVEMEAEFLNGEGGECRIAGDYRSRSCLISDDTAEIHCLIASYGHEMAGVPAEYVLRQGGRVLKHGEVFSSDTLSLDLSSYLSGIYEFELKVSLRTGSGREIKASRVYKLVYLRDGGFVPAGVDRLVRGELRGGDVIMQLGSGTGPVWAVVELFGENRTLLMKEMVMIDGAAGQAGSLMTAAYRYRDEYPDKIMLNVFFFRNGEDCHYSEWFSRPQEKTEMSLEFVSFVDEALPGQECTVRMRTNPGCELVAAVYDVSSDKIAENLWFPVEKGERGQYQYVMYASAAGSVMGSGHDFMFYADEMNARGYAKARLAAPMTGSVDFEAEEETFMNSESADVEVRDDFAATLAFEPFLRPDKDGMVELKFRTSDKLSVFRAMVYAHDRDMNNSLVAREMQVTLPVKVSAFIPQYLYAGDRYVLNASVSNTSGSVLKGRLRLEVYEGDSYQGAGPIIVDCADISVPAGGSVSAGFGIDVPEGADSLGFKAVFTGHEYSSALPVNDVVISDGIFVPVPVYPAAQVLTEAHSAVLTGGQADEVALERLRKEFVNVSSIGAEYSETTLADLLREAVPGAVRPESDNVVSLSEALYVNVLAYGLHDGRWGISEDSGEAGKCIGAVRDIVRKLVKCRNADGGFGWFEGMPSSPVVTAVVLERCCGLGEDFHTLFDVMEADGLEEEFDKVVEDAVKYLDSSYFSGEARPLWYGGLTLEQYLCVRSEYAGVPFDMDAAVKSAGKKGYEAFRKDVRAYLIPRISDRKPDGRILSKARKIRILRFLPDELAEAWGLNSRKRMEESCRIEMESLKQYAVRHPSGGIYYPNAVMPWRGLMEGEAYAHAVIGELAMCLAVLEKDDEWAEIAKGISVWVMLQKETQEWSSDPGFVEALSLVNHNAGQIRDVRIVKLSKTYSKPFDEIKPAGNGFRVGVDYYRKGADGEPVKLVDGDSLKVGDKITAVYSLWSGENRSHVRLSVPRAACFRPAEQLSGWSGGWFRPFMYRAYNVSPYAYREVKADRTLWWIDVFPEEDTKIEEELFVTQEGTFSAPAAELESMYSPHYRANGKCYSWKF